MLACFKTKGQAKNDFFFVTYNLDERSNLFWNDWISWYNYGCSSDIIGFDATYNKKKYKKPTIIVIGTNSH